MNEIEMHERMATLETRVNGIEVDLRQVRIVTAEAHRPLNRSEKIALAASGSAVIGAVLASVAFLSGGP